MTSARTVTLRSYAKINLDLRVQNRRPDGFHRIATIFQTISLADRITLAVRPALRTAVSLTANIEIPDNLMLRAADAVLRATKARVEVRMTLDKRIPMGGGLGGGSSNAAAVLLALSALAGKPVDAAKLESIAAGLGSDVPFFLYGGTALGLGRGTELVPLSEPPPMHGILIAPGIHVSTPDAYRALERDGTAPDDVLPQGTRDVLRQMIGGDWLGILKNDFEESVYRMHSELKKIHSRLEQSHARAVRMSGSGSTVFAIYGSAAEARLAMGQVPWASRQFRTVSRREYQKQFQFENSAAIMI